MIQLVSRILDHVFIPAILVFTLITTSCQAPLYVTRSLPPEINLYNRSGQICLVSLFDTALVDFNQKKKEKVYLDAYNHFLSGLDTLFNEKLGCRLVIPDKVEKPGDSIVSGESATGINTERFALFYRNPARRDSIVTAFFDQSDIPNLLVLESYNLDRDKEVETYENDDGSISKTVYYSLKGMSTLSFFSFPGKLVHKAQIVQSVPINQREVLSGLLAIGPSMGNYGKEANEVTANMALDYVNRFLPGSEDVMLFYYTPENRYLIT